MPNIVLECINLCKTIKNKEIIKNINLTLYEQDILGFIGPNGAGKTTTIKTILSLQKKTKGKVKINGIDIKKNYKKAISQVGAIIENPDLYNYLSGLDNLLISAKIYNIEKNRVEEVINLVGLSKRINDKVSTYSLGMKQRLGIAQAIIHNPKLLILDEPTNGLDPEGIKELRELLIILAQKEKMAILISSHNLKELESLCTKICMLKNGQIIEQTTINKLETKTQNYILELNNTNLNNLLKNYEKLDNNHIKISLKKDQIPKIIKKLITQNIKIYSIKEETLNLEDIYLQKTGGNIID